MFEEFRGMGPGDYRFRSTSGVVTGTVITWCQKNLKMDWHYSRFVVYLTDPSDVVKFRQQYGSKE